MNWKKLELWLLYLIASLFFVLACLPAQAINTEQFDCPKAMPMLVYVINPDGTIRAIVGSTQYAYIFCQSEYCKHDDSRAMESYIRREAEPASMIRRVQLP